jgi:hypothetical protein
MEIKEKRKTQNPQKYIDCVCETCGKTFRYAMRWWRPKGRYCSRKCSYKRHNSAPSVKL